MRIKVPFQNPRTGEIKTVKLGFSWVLLLFSGVLGIPLFMRKLYPLGAVFLCLWVLNIVLPRLAHLPGDQTFLSLSLVVIIIGLSIWVGLKGNQYTVRHLLDTGWVFAEPQSEFTRAAAKKWGVVVKADGPAGPGSMHAQRLGA